MPTNEGASMVGLRGVRLLAGLSDAELQRVAGLCTWKVHKPNLNFPIVSRDALDTDVYFLVSGRVRVEVQTYADSDEAEGRSKRTRGVIFRELRAGDHFGELAAIDGAKRSADIFALEESLVYHLSAKAFLGLVDEIAPLRRNLLNMLVSIVRDLSNRVFDFGTLRVLERLRGYVLQLAEERGVQGNRARIDPLPAHGDIASRIGTSREEVTRGFRQMKDDGLIVTLDTHAIEVVDVARLRELVQPGAERPPRR